MLTQQEAIDIACKYLEKDWNQHKYKFHSIDFWPNMGGPYASMGDTWLVRFTLIPPPGIRDIDLYFVHVNPDTGAIVKEPKL